MDTEMEEVEDDITCRGTCKKKVWPKYGRSNFLRHITQAKKCKELYTQDEIEKFQSLSYNRKKQMRVEGYDENEKNKELKRQRESYDENEKNKRLKRQRDSYDEDEKNKRLKRQRESYDEDRNKKLKRQRLSYDPKKRKEKYKTEQLSTMKERLKTFNHECQHGPIFVCVCCMRVLFKRGVRKITASYEEQLFASQMIDNLQTENVVVSEDPKANNDVKIWEKQQGKRLKLSLQVHGSHYLCCNCCKYLEKLEMPPCCAKNGLEYPDIPDCLQLSNLERQMICKDLVFIKIRRLPSYMRMEAMNDHIINVPIEDDDIIKTVTSLPRTQKNNGLVTVGLKRDMALKKMEKLQMIHPERVHAALLQLKENHPSYKNINISSLQDWKDQLLDSNEDKNFGHDGTDESSDFEIEPEEGNQQSNQSDEGIFNSITCLYSENPLANVVGKYNLFLEILTKICSLIFAYFQFSS